MKQRLFVAVTSVALSVAAAPGQDRAGQQGAPIYQITVVERTMKAVNYQYRNGPTTIDFRGTVLLPKAKGEATVESKQGRTEIDLKLQNFTTPQGFGLEYMTYVLWAITPEGRPRNLGEIVPNGSNKASLRVTTDLKAFGLLVTAEPYSAVRQPGDVVVAENQIRDETVGKIEEISVKYGLMPRGHYTWNVPGSLKSEVENAPKVSMRKYEALLELYQARNAVAIARNAGADRYAAETFNKAQALLTEAQQLNAFNKGDSRRVVDSAREAAQTAEDARMIAEQRIQEEQLAQAQAKATAAQQAQVRAEADAQKAREAAHAAQAQAEADRIARQRAEAETAAARLRAAQAQRAAQEALAKAAAAPAARIPSNQPDPVENEKRDLRMRLLEQLNGALATRDTAWGLMVTLPESTFIGAALRPTSTGQLRQVSQIVKPHSGLRIVIEGHSDGPATEALMTRRAEAVKQQLASAGLSLSMIEVRSMGESRPLVSNKTEAGREQNRRVEIIISGDPIGKLPFWDRPYTLSRRRV